MNIITGYRGEAHITSQQDQAKNQGIFGQGSYVLDVGEKLRAEAISANEVRVYDGVLSHQGVVAVVEKNTYDSIDITNGSQGTSRIDLIVARYTKASETGIEDVSLEVITGTEADSNPSVPEYNTGDIQAGDSPVDMPLYQVRINGIAIESVDLVANVVDANSDAFFQRDILPSGNLNNATEFGTYQLITANTYTNMPSDITQGQLMVFKSGGGFISQLVHQNNSYDNEVLWYRYYTTSWSAWKPVGAGGTKSITDANDAQLEGITYVVSGNGTNMPAYVDYAHIWVHYQSQQYRTQILSQTNTNMPRMYVRSSVQGGDFGDWMEVALYLQSRTLTAVGGGTLGNIAFYRYGRMATISFNRNITTNLAAGTDITIATVPDNMKPLANTYLGGTLKNNSTTWIGYEVRILTSGSIVMSVQSAMSGGCLLRVNGSYITAT